MQTDKLCNVFDKLSQIEKEFVLNMRENKAIYVGGVISYKSKLSNGIKFFTQSVFSHTNFVDPKTYNVIGAEEMQSVTFLDYKKSGIGDFYYVIKMLNLDNLATMYSFTYIQSLFLKLGKISDNDFFRIQNKFYTFCTIRLNHNKSSLIDLLQMYDQDIAVDKNIKKQIDEFMAQKTLFKNMILDKITDLDSYYKYFNLLKEFIVLGIVKHIILNLHKNYDIKGTLSTSLIPWKPITLSGKEFFCSEFVAESLLFAGIYPFDMETKDPESITPGDIMDSNIIFNGSKTQFYHIYPKDDSVNIIELIPSESFEFFKNYVIQKESTNRYFNKQKMYIEFFDSIFKILANSIRSSYIDKSQYFSQSSIIRLSFSLFFLFVFGLTYVVFSSSHLYISDIHNNSGTSFYFLNDFLFKYLITFLHFIVGFILFLLFLYVFFFYIVPLFKVLKSFILKFIRRI